MSDPLDVLVGWFRWGMALVGLAALGLGAFSAVSPGRSIALYQRLMTQFNWRVSPIDEARELRNTKLLGALLVLLSLVDFWLLVSKSLR